VRLERLRWWDLPAVQRLEHALFGDAAWTPGQFWSELARVPETRWYLVARGPGPADGDVILGYAGVFVAGDRADVQTVAVAHGAQGRGLGGQLVAGLAVHASGRGADRLHLEVRAGNAPALALYGRLGFVVDGRRRDYYGRGQDAVLMTAPLPLAGADQAVAHG
jgi:ribosomal-protein-alanine N-acetyltransferase